MAAAFANAPREVAAHADIVADPTAFIKFQAANGHNTGVDFIGGVLQVRFADYVYRGNGETGFGTITKGGDLLGSLRRNPPLDGWPGVLHDDVRGAQHWEQWAYDPRETARPRSSACARWRGDCERSAWDGCPADRKGVRGRP